MSAAAYPPMARALHWLALGSRTQTEMAFGLEQALYLASAPAPARHRHVFVQGLARAGTTTLMRALYGTGVFGSLTYADMPFVMCANTWSTLTRRSHRVTAAAERAHGDGVMVNTESPEALDEVFWRTFCGPDYLHADRLTPHVPPADVLDGYATYIRLLLRRSQRERYLSKNNNNVLRLPALARRFPDSVFLVPVRNPVRQAASLLRQHQRFSGSDPFTRRYMTWLGHHEFGDTHRRFRFREAPPDEPEPGGPAYWLSLWSDCYGYLETITRDLPNVYFIPYESLCEEPWVWRRIQALVDAPSTAAEPFKISAGAPDELHGHSDAAEAQFRRITDLARARLSEVPDSEVPD